jgi:hypothetical protein
VHQCCTCVLEGLGWNGFSGCEEESKQKKGSRIEGQASTGGGVEPSRARRSGAAAGHRIRKPHPALTHRNEPVSSCDYPYIQFRYDQVAVLVSYIFIS